MNRGLAGLGRAISRRPPASPASTGRVGASTPPWLNNAPRWPRCRLGRSGCAGTIARLTRAIEELEKQRAQLMAGRGTATAKLATLP